MNHRSLHPRNPVLAFALAAMGIAIAAHALHAISGFGHPSLDGFFKDGVYSAIEFVAAFVCAARALRRRANRAAWLLIAFSLLTWAAGDLLWTVWLGDLANPPFPSIADALYLAMYPATYVALILLMRSHFRQASAAAWLDGIVVGLTAAAIGAGLVFPAVLGVSKGSAAEVAVNLAYPLADLSLLVVLAIGFALSGWRPGRQWLLLSLGIAISAIADMIYVYQTAKGTYIAGHILDTMWPVSMAVLALAAWQPARAAIARPALDRHTVIFPAAAGVAALALLVSATLHPLTRLSVTLATAALLAAGARAGLTYMENVRMLKLRTLDAVTDGLTGLGNRRGLMDALKIAVERGREGRRCSLAFFDLDGFKHYNDSFGHLAGDALLARLAGRLSVTVEGLAIAYRIGGDEFCVLTTVDSGRGDGIARLAAAALSEAGDSFDVSCSYGLALLPDEVASPEGALQLADRRMYDQKLSGRVSVQRQTTDVLLKVLGERNPELQEHVFDVRRLAELMAERLDLPAEDVGRIRLAAELHDVGKTAIPDAILNKPGSLDEAEWRFMRRHTVIGERIVLAAPALAHTAELVRASHERVDGAGYPDQLRGHQIPLGSRIIAICDAFDAMVTERPYRTAMSASDAMAELRRCAGTQFDAELIEVFESLVDDHALDRASSATGNSRLVHHPPMVYAGE